MGGVFLAAIGAVMIILALRGPDAWTAAWNLLVTPPSPSGAGKAT